MFLVGDRIESRSSLNLTRSAASRPAAGQNRLVSSGWSPATCWPGAASPIAAVQPYNGEYVSQSPQDLVITFNGLNVPAFMGSFDVQIEELNRDGTKTPIWKLRQSTTGRVGRHRNGIDRAATDATIRLILRMTI